MNRSKKARNRPKEFIEGVPVTGAGADGKGLAKIDGFVYFISGAVPGDVVDLRVDKKKKSYAEATATRIVSPSADRVEPFCPHFGLCGGCKSQDLSYAKQIEYKRQQVIDNLERIGGLTIPEVPPTLPSPHTRQFRNKLEYTFSSHRWLLSNEVSDEHTILDRNALGFHIPGRFDRVLELSECHLQPEPSESIRKYLRQHAREHGLSFYDIRAHVGFLRTVTIRTTTTGECMVVLALGHEDLEKREAILSGLQQAVPGITSLQWVINEKKNDTIWDLETFVFSGRDHVIEELPDGPGGKPLQFRIGPKTFFQTNPEQTKAMYALTRDWAGLTGNELVYDLYCGAGSISLYVAGNAKKVIGAEIVPEAVEDAMVNARLNGITNVHFEAGDLRKLLDASFAERHGRPDVVITDPPRAGMHEDVVMRLRELAPQRIVYVSCNPATQARDLALLQDMYRITHVQCVDMFPHTYHIENIVRLERY